MHNNSPFIAIINRVMRLHSPTHDQSNCAECGHSWPCKTVTSIKNSKDEGINIFNDEPTAVDLGHALQAIDETYSAHNAKGERLVAAIHNLVLHPELSVVGGLYPETEIQISLRLNNQHALFLWKLVLSKQPVVHLHAALDDQEGRHLLSGLLTDSFAPVESQQLIEWWRSMKGSGNRSVIFDLPHRPSAAIAVLQTLCDATVQLVDSAVPVVNFEIFTINQ